MSSLLEDDTRYVKLVLLLVKGGTYVFKKHTQNILDDVNTTIDICLNTHRDKLSEKKEIYPKLWELLCSNSGQSKDLDVLDISAHAYVLLNLFYNRLKAVEIDAITKLRKKRNELVHRGGGIPLSEKQFRGEWRQLIKVLDQLSARLSSNDQDYVDRLIDNIEAIKHLDEATDELKPFKNQEDFVKDMLTKLQCRYEKRFDVLHQRLCDLEKFKQNIEGRLLELFTRITVIASTPTASDEAYRLLLEAIKRFLAGGHDNHEGDEVFTALNNMFTDMSKDGASIKKVEEGSDLIIFSCSTLTSLKSALLYLTRTVYIHRLQELEKALSQSVGCCVKLNVNIVLESLISTLDKEASSIPRARRFENDLGVAFYAVITNHLEHIGAKQNIVFNLAITNEGNAYNIYAGDFRAPVAGTYSFSTTLREHGTSQLTQYCIAKNNDHVGNLALMGNIEPFSSYALTVVLKLNQGDTISVRNLDTDTQLNGNYYSVFSGFLLQEDYTGLTIVG